MRHVFRLMATTVMAMSLSFCAMQIHPTVHPPDAPPASLWVAPADLEQRDLFNGPWAPRVRPIRTPATGWFTSSTAASIPE